MYREIVCAAATAAAVAAQVVVQLCLLQYQCLSGRVECALLTPIRSGARV